MTRPEAADTRFTGAYALADGTLVFMTPREGKVLRYRMMNGEARRLWPTGDGEYEGGPGWDRREPVVNHVKFDRAAPGGPASTGAAPTTRSCMRGASICPSARRCSRAAIFSCAASWCCPTRRYGPGPFPAVVIVHGSESYSAVDYYSEPYLYAANGFAAFVFDKRGTGESEGKYLQNFHVLSDDVVAAVRWLRTQPGIDGDRIHLAGFSQGGWIAPLAALKDGNIRSVLVGYGVMVPVHGRGSLGLRLCAAAEGLRRRRRSPQADRINAVIEDIFDRRQNRWCELGEPDRRGTRASPGSRP